MLIRVEKKDAILLIHRRLDELLSAFEKFDFHNSFDRSKFRNRMPVFLSFLKEICDLLTKVDEMENIH